MLVATANFLDKGIRQSLPDFLSFFLQWFHCRRICTSNIREPQPTQSSRDLKMLLASDKKVKGITRMVPRPFQQLKMLLAIRIDL